MPALPSIEQYNEAVQAPTVAFVDPVLQRGHVLSNAFGIPIALGGGFALTYTINSGGKKLAVRCFHKQAPGLQDRYAKISSTIASANSNHFVGFQYQPGGIRVLGNLHPIVKMDWVEGETLGIWLERRYKDKAALTTLVSRFRALEKQLRDKGIAHGDLQNGNVLVVGSDIRLIDYDGLFVPGLPAGQGNEVGHKHFQHPQRGGADFGPAMDRFSFIVIDLSLRAVAEKPALFQKHSNGENILFSGADYLDPAASAVFSDVRAIPSLVDQVDNFAKVCRAPLSATPSLEDFLAGRNIPAVQVQVRPSGQHAPVKAPVGYVGAYDVIDARNYNAALLRVGDRVELVGQIVEVKESRTRHGRPYVFVNFGPWKGSIVKLSIWSDGLAKLTQQPDQSWKGKWISVVGLLEPPYVSRRYQYSHISITIEEPNQYRFITAEEAKRRLASLSQGPVVPLPGNNRAILDTLSGGASRPGGRSRTAVRTPVSPAKTSNQQILDALKHGQPQASQSSSTPRPTAAPPPPAKEGFPKWIIWIVVIAIIVYLASR